MTSGIVPWAGRLLAVDLSKAALDTHCCMQHVPRKHDMALGKRKRRDELNDPEDAELGSNGDNIDLQTLLRQHFETKFRPLVPTSLPAKVPTVARSQSASEGETSDWDGLSEEEHNEPEVIELEASWTSSEDIPIEELRSFMVNIHSQFIIENVI